MYYRGKKTGYHFYSRDKYTICFTLVTTFQCYCDAVTNAEEEPVQPHSTGHSRKITGVNNE